MCRHSELSVRPEVFKSFLTQLLCFLAYKRENTQSAANNFSDNYGKSHVNQTSEKKISLWENYNNYLNEEKQKHLSMSSSIFYELSLCAVCWSIANNHSCALQLQCYPLKCSEVEAQFPSEGSTICSLRRWWSTWVWKYPLSLKFLRIFFVVV